MKKILCTLAVFAMMIGGARADEGMWLLPLLYQMNAEAMGDLGCRLTPDQIYSINHSSLKDAIVQFGGGCTGEMISGQGLLVTNHHCGYSSIQGLSTPEHNYLENGFWAMNRSEEIPVPGLTVTFMERMTDITDIIDKLSEKTRKQFRKQENVDELVGQALEAAMEQLVEQAEKENPNCHAEIMPFYNDNIYYLIVYKTYKDVRFVGAPPASLGKFGGETDNWEWPRHTCDFSMFRVYADKDNQPAEYAETNVPYAPKQSLKVSLKGYGDGDFSMIMGYPGGTQRFQSADMLQLMIDQQAVAIKARTARQNAMLKHMEADPNVRLQYANKYASSANGWKKWQGEALAFQKLNIIGREQQKEKDFMEWVGKKNKRQELYGDAIKDMKEGVAVTRDPELKASTLTESVYRIGPLTNAYNFIRNFNAGVRRGTDTTEALSAAIDATAELFKDYDDATERDIAAAMLEFFRDNAAEGEVIEGLEDIKTMDIPAYVKGLFDASIFANKDKLLAAKNMTVDQIGADPAAVLSDKVVDKILEYYPAMNAGEEQVAKGAKAYAAGLMEWQKGQPMYPDANFTMRLTYGTVKPYSPKDGVLYNYYTTLKGVMEKEDPDNYEFRVPARLKELYNEGSYGQYANEKGELPACFLINCDITGGNSGSPVMNADGDLIGLAFDGNWESMSSDVMFEPDLQRCICVDIRYVLFVMDRFGGAGYLLNEMNLVK